MEFAEDVMTRGDIGTDPKGEDVGSSGGGSSAADAVSLFRCRLLLRFEVRSGEVEGRPSEEQPWFV